MKYRVHSFFSEMTSVGSVGMAPVFPMGGGGEKMKKDFHKMNQAEMRRRDLTGPKKKKHRKGHK
jgi:hypothetical protein